MWSKWAFPWNWPTPIRCASDTQHYNHYNHHHLFSMLGWVGQFIMNNFQAFLSLAMSFLTFLFIQVTSDYSLHIFLVHHWKKTTTNPELELRVCDLWITNQFLDHTNQKLVKLPFFTNCLFSRYGNFKIMSTDDICLSICLNLDYTMKEKNSAECLACLKLRHTTLS